MEQGVTFRAPWCVSLITITLLLVVIIVGTAIIGILSGPTGNILWIFAMVFPLLLLSGAMFFMIRGYVLADNMLFIQRLGWNSKVDLASLKSVEIDPQAMAKSIRTCGNGGLFCFAGAFWNKKLGSYRAFATDPKRAVVLKFARRVVVVTPERPEEFAAKTREMKNLQ